MFDNNPEPDDEYPETDDFLYEMCEYCGKKDFHTRMYRLTFWNHKNKIVWRCKECRISMQNFAFYSQNRHNFINEGKDLGIENTF